MAGMGAGYDLSVSTFSPDGRVFQVEYASKAVDNSTTAIAFSCKDGVVLAVQKIITNPMQLHHKTNRRVYPVDKHIAIAISGFIADGRQLIQRARSECEFYHKFFGEPIPVRVLAERMGMYVHAYTLYWSVRPFGAALLIAAVDLDEKLSRDQRSKERGEATMDDSKTAASSGSAFGGGCGEVYCVEPSGTCYKYIGQSIGKGKQTAKTELEKLKLSELSGKEALVQAARILYSINDDNKDKKMDVELGWITEGTGYKYQSISEEIAAEVSETAKNLIDSMEEDAP
eukprot:GHVQ01037548.1.p1 GENE.GHVQ01037548.1~~GHVQ01037548.1.p1  ORF type:complete len:318 (+),score=35.08 GHVQ01037548.1:97-954(+)